jgi:2,4-dienoyl-CoA reductase-like NADH-dependent reductase (Old Yellow Enzyme family)
MADPINLVRIPTLKSVDDFRRHVSSLKIDLPCDDSILSGSSSPLSRPVEEVRINGKQIGNRFAIQPMEGWDATTTGSPTPEVTRRWQRFGQSGAKLIFGGEAMAVRPDGRANPNQLVIHEGTKADLAKLCQLLVEAHKLSFTNTDDLVIGFQLTHSGRFCKPNDKFCFEPRIAYRHPILDRRFGVIREEQIWTDSGLEELTQDFIRAAKFAREAGADFVDIKHCHGYLLHELLSAFTRPGKYGGSFENRTRMLREIVSGIRASGNDIDLAVRLSAFDFVPFKPDPLLSKPGKPGPGIPEDFGSLLPYQYAFGVNAENPVEFDLTETIRFLKLCGQLGIKLVNVSAGSPYYNPHIQRPAAYPPSDGYRPPEDPLVGVARQVNVVRRLKKSAPQGLLLIGTAYSYLQEYLPHVAQYVIRDRWTDLIGLGRMALSYPAIPSDVLAGAPLLTKSICRTFSDCTTAPRNGLMSGCYPLDKYYSEKPESQKLKEAKKR